jgi:hypothetical protein
MSFVDREVEPHAAMQNEKGKKTFGVEKGVAYTCQNSEAYNLGSFLDILQ